VNACWVRAVTLRNLDTKTVHISIVSHGQSRLTSYLLEDIERYCLGVSLHVTVTLNIPEPLCFDARSFRFPVHLLQNTRPQGFSANHNAAFRYGQREYPCEYFSVINPDIRFSSDPFPGLMACLEGGRAGVVAPLVLNTEGEIEDSARRFPTPLRILARALGKSRRPDYAVDRGTASPDWVAGMFMLFPTNTYHRVGGFDEGYFLYYEDVDLCARLKVSGYDVQFCPSVRVVHDAQRQSHRNLKYLRWHITSMMRFFLSRVYLSLVWQQIIDRMRPRA
jgi:N-acetylglucosaminyl-diphospho-decaprenol L-rhamnosyltransferase